MIKHKGIMKYWINAIEKSCVPGEVGFTMVLDHVVADGKELSLSVRYEHKDAWFFVSVREYKMGPEANVSPEPIFSQSGLNCSQVKYIMQRFFNWDGIAQFYDPAELENCKVGEYTRRGHTRIMPSGKVVHIKGSRCRYYKYYTV